MRRFRYHVTPGLLVVARRGTILTWFAVFLFALLPLMALVVHLGMVTLTRRQMQTAVNTAALEGLRFRDAELTETERRERVRALVSAVFDDNLNSDDDDAMQFGAGPVIDFDPDNGIAFPGTDFRAARTISQENIGVYDRVLQLNESDEPHGDMLRGNYFAGSGHIEENDYLRPEDFVPDANGDAFLVRLRRTDDAAGLDNIAGVSSHGPPIPFLFGRGGITRAVNDLDPAALWNRRNRRERGTVVRATAIAQRRPALTVGWYDMDVGEGLGPIVVTYSEWTAMTQPIPVKSSHFVQPTPGPLSIGSPRPMPFVDMLPDFNGERRFVAIVDDLTNPNRVIGFGTGVLVYDPMTDIGTVSKEPTVVAVTNASAQFLSPPGALSAMEWEAVFVAHRSFVPDSPSFAPASEPLLAPALVRAVE